MLVEKVVRVTIEFEFLAAEGFSDIHAYNCVAYAMQLASGACKAKVPDMRMVRTELIGEGQVGNC